VGSIQVNTFPSAHAAGSIAVALAVASAIPSAGVVFLVLGLGITIATVLGRYHYLADSVLGVAVGTVAWLIL
jgi:membrane-associated phospholipid phosphatase